ncbi:hypothetical protein OIU93_20400 [Paeniglutamicibacter sp. ZC-3]|uniref:hypothetical protein n=1 Tax=Paeniglutamicibacter sp. ZC-3 TaxID=2986919 RepID=UPI0021F79436|nr:hypothetical protein [Paeniglutamicibacter sp. ZC-3]MCV9996613.1 hypothetical protein [Paeniglutamicibacter sp. ZC-3]
MSLNRNARRQRPNRLRLCAAIVMCAGLLLSSVSPAATTAAWKNAEHSSADFSALVVPAPIIDSCTAEIGIAGVNLKPRITLIWHYPSTEYALNDAQYWYGDVPAIGSLPVLGPLLYGEEVSTTGTDPGPYTSTFEGGLLTDLLGGTTDVGVSATHESGWSSKVSTARATFPLLLLGEKECDFTNAS